MPDIAPPLPAPRETLPSFLSRVSAYHRVDLPTFLEEMGLPVRGTLGGDAGSLEQIAEVARISLAEADELVSWSGMAIGDVRMRFRDEVFVSRALRNPEVRGCPVCLREDALAHGVGGATAMVMRGHWQLRYVRVCVRHGVDLVPLWRERSPVRRFDQVPHLRRIEADVMSGDLNGADRSPTEFDLWLDERLANPAAGPALDQPSLYAATETCLLLGGELNACGKAGGDDTGAVHAALGRGFEALRNGEHGIGAALADLLGRRVDPQDGPKKVFGRLYIRLDGDLAEDEAFQPMRDRLRRVILETWAIAPGAHVLGERLEHRLRHSVRTAAAELGLKTVTLRSILVEKGAIAADDTRPDAVATFDVERWGPLLEDLPKLMGEGDMARSLGISPGQLRSLASLGVIAPFVSTPSIKRPWRPADADAFLSSLLPAGAPTADAHEGWIGLQPAAPDIAGGVRYIIEAVHSGRIETGRMSGREGYPSIVVREADVARIIGEDWDTDEDAWTVSAFQRQIGLSRTGSFARLVEDGHTPATMLMNVATRNLRKCITEADAAAFRGRFVTAKMLATERGVATRVMAAELKSGGVRPFSAGGTAYDGIWSRASLADEEG
ncbi:MAG: TniQ family protein [Planctomycetota bacterium]